VRVGLHDVTASDLQLLRLLLVVVGADELRRVAERRILSPDPRERQDRDDRALHAAFEEHVADGDLKQVPDLTLAFRATDVQGHRIDHVLSGLLLQQDPSHLRPVAVGDDDLPAGGRDVGDPLGG